MDRNGKVSLFFTLVIITVIIFASPSKAVILGVDSDRSSYGISDSTVAFTAYIDINYQGERLPVQNITLKIRNSSNSVVDTCTFTTDGSNMTACSNIINITALGVTPYGWASGPLWGFGYGYNATSYYTVNTSFGTGYGYGYAGSGYNYGGVYGAEFEYNITWNLTKANLTSGNYSALLEAAVASGNNSFTYVSDNTTLSFSVDTSTPVIENVSAATDTITADIVWDTDEIANSTVSYGINSSLASSVTNSTQVLSHNISLSSLSSNTTYYYNVTSCDSFNCNTTGMYNFTTNATSTAISAIIYDLQLMVSKTIFGLGERIEIYGYLYNITASSETGVPSVSINLSLLNISNDVISNYTFTTGSNGEYYSRSDYYPSATVINAPSTTGNYTLNATYTNGSATTYSVITINVINQSIDDIRLEPNKAIYYPSSNITLTARAIQYLGDNDLPVANVSINGTLRDSDFEILNTFSCTTDANGLCVYTNLIAPSTSGRYILEANNYVGYTTFSVVAFDVDVFMKDSTGTSIKNVFKKGDTGYVEVRVGYNSTTASGNYTVSSSIYNSNGTLISTLTGFSLDSNNSYSNKVPFTINNNLTVGEYKTKVSVRKIGGETINSTAIFQVRDWTLSVSKTSSNSGFEYGYTAFANSTVYFDASVIERGNGSAISGLNNNFTITLKNNFGAQMTNSSAFYNSSTGTYTFNLTMPSIQSSYTLSVTLANNDDTQSVEKLLTVTTIRASALSTDVNENKRDIFSMSEFAYIKVTAKNKTSNVNVTDIDIVSIKYQDGTEKNYTYQSNWSLMNFTDTDLEWGWNSTSSLVILDPPSTGGLFTVEMFVNNKSANTWARLRIKPYEICTAAKASSDTTQSDYYWQFQTTDTIYLQMKVHQTKDASSLSLANLTTSSAGYYYGYGGACQADTTKTAINNATITIKGVKNMRNGNTETLNSTASICYPIDQTGGYMCVIKPYDNLWDGGKYRVVVEITGPNGVTSDEGFGTFEARAFYIYGWSNLWSNKPTGDINFTIYMYSAGSGWWSSRSGIDGTVTLESVQYRGTPGEWMWQPVTYNYNTTGLSASTISSGAGTISLSASRAPNGTWKPGYYSAIIKGTDSSSGESDYGELWFEIRNWYAYANPVELSSGTYQYKYQFNTRENVSLYVKIMNAGDAWGTYGSSLGGNVDISIKKLEFYTTWPPKEVPAANYTATTITVNQSNRDIWSASTGDDNYIINITPVSGRWDSGYYQVVLDLNGTETGWGWFSALAFYIDTQPMNENGTYEYNTRGRGPVYFNVTTTKNRKYYYSYYSTVDFVNTTISDMVLRRWNSNTWQQIDYNYPEDINISIVGSNDLNVTGRSMLNVTYNNGTWPGGSYNGEIIMINNESEKVTGWLWFNVEPFRIQATANPYTIATDNNLTVELTIYEPGWTWPYTIQEGNYSIDSIIKRTWNYAGELRTDITNYTLGNGTAIFNGSIINLTIEPPSGRWESGWVSITVTIKDIDTNETKDGWISFRAVPFTISLSRTSPYTIGLSGNLTFNATLSHPISSQPETGNLTSVYRSSWPSNIYYNFSVNGCNSRTSSSCLINGTSAVVVEAPLDGWEEGYNYFYTEFTDDNDSTRIDDWSSVYFNARPTLRGYMYAVDSNGNYQYATSFPNNITIYLYSLQDLSGGNVAVNVTNVLFSKSPDGCWDDSCRTYSSATWSVVNVSTGESVGNNEIDTAGYIKLVPSGGLWEGGDYYVKVYITNGTDSSIIKNGYFKIKDMVAPNVSINTPTLAQVITENNIFFNASTTEDARCDIMIVNYDRYYSWYCSGNVSAACNTSYNGSVYTYSWISGWSGQVSTGGTAHTYNLSLNTSQNQDYGIKFYCYDSDWNYGTNETVITLNRTAQPYVAWVSTGVNTTLENASAEFSVLWETNVNLSGYIFSWNASGSWVNDTWTAFTNNWSNVSKTLNYSSGTIISWRVYANNSAGTWNVTDISAFIVNATTTPSVSYIIINATSSNNYTTDNLVCYTIGVNNENSLLTAYYRWYKNGALNYSGSRTAPNNTLTINRLLSGNTSKGENWTCSVSFGNDNGNSSWSNSSALTVLNSPPTAPNLTQPTNGSTTSDNTTSFNWTASTDSDNDTITYAILISSSTGFEVGNITQQNHSLSTLNYTSSALSDATYFWKVKAVTSDANSSWSGIRNIIINITG
ncbi:MAG: hypothetical protein ISS36_02945 [Candidatus Aenigmarchaeota archaeon]|nr:hypothetical protein [Candidatus Aenigmarchaeota archaeon]